MILQETERERERERERETETETERERQRQREGVVVDIGYGDVKILTESDNYINEAIATGGH